MRCAALLILLAAPASAWEFTPGLPCLLTHRSGGVDVELTYDPTQPLYTISITRPVAWADAPVFSLRFVGSAGLEISTDRQVFSEGGRRLTVTDRGFGNVLNGLQFNETAIAILGDEAVRIPLEGAAGPVEAFRQCRPVAGV